MGFWQAVAKGMLDKAEYDRVTRQQQAYDAQPYHRGPGLIATFFANRRATQDASQYWANERRFEQNRRDWNDMFSTLHGTPRRACNCGDPNCRRG